MSSDSDDDDDLDFGDRFGRILGTIVLLFFAFTATNGYFIGERHFSARGGVLDEAAGLVAELPSVDVVSPQWDKRVVHASGEPRVLAGATDPLLGVSADAVCIHRKVEYYQWQEEEQQKTDSYAGVRRVVYERRWVKKPIDSSRFRHASPSRDNTLVAVIASADSPARQVAMGGYELGDAIKTIFPNARPLPVRLTPEQREAIARQVIPGGESGNAALVHNLENGVYFGRDPRRPAVGDVRVNLTAAWPGKISVVARTDDGRLDAFVGENGQSLAIVRGGEAGQGRMLGGAIAWNTLGLWGCRLGLAVLYGLFLLFIAKIHGRRGRGIFFLGAALACVVMAAVWLANHPGRLQGLAFLPVAAAAFGMWLSRRTVRD